MCGTWMLSWGSGGNINKRLWAQPVVSSGELGKLQKALGRCSKWMEGINASKNFPALVRAALSVLEDRSSWGDCLSLPHLSLQERKEELWMSAGVIQSNVCVPGRAGCAAGAAGAQQAAQSRCHTCTGHRVCWHWVSASCPLWALSPWGMRLFTLQSDHINMITRIWSLKPSQAVLAKQSCVCRAALGSWGGSHRDVSWGRRESAGRQELLLGFVCWNLPYFHSSRVLSLFPDILSPEWGERISLGTGGTLGGKWGWSK